MDVITFPEYLGTTSDLSNLLHGVISLPDRMSSAKEGKSGFIYNLVKS